MTHLTVEQCRNLKEWGMPQDTEAYWSDPSMTGEHYLLYHGKQTDTAWNGNVACPTLEELILWIDCDFHSLEPFRNGYISRLYDYEDVEIPQPIADTPTEALYNLASARQDRYAAMRARGEL